MSEETCLRPRDPVELLLKNILRNTLICAGVCSLVGCGANDAGGTESSTGSAGKLPERCDARWTVDASALSPAESYEYLAIRRIDLDNAHSSSSSATWTIQSQVGEPCADASNKATCSAALQVEPSDCVPILYSQIGCSEVSAVTTRGDEVKRWAGAEASIALLGEIDSAAEAELLAIIDGYAVCSNEPARDTADGHELFVASWTDACPPVQIGHRVRVRRDGAIEELSSKELETANACPGRMPAGLCSVAADRGEDELGDMLARAAHMEAASVFAFERLAQELSQHGAPAALIEAALAARADEIDHAHRVATLARAHGGQPVAAEVLPFAERSLEEIARENAVEGCVRETYSALVGAHQAVRAEDSALRNTMQKIADDEARHAALSHQVHTWVMAKLDDGARARVKQAQGAAVRELCAACLNASDSELDRRAGFPSTQAARSMVAQLARTLWSDALEARNRRANA